MSESHNFRSRLYSFISLCYEWLMVKVLCIYTTLTLHSQSSHSVCKYECDKIVYTEKLLPHLCDLSLVVLGV